MFDFGDFLEVGVNGLVDSVACPEGSSISLKEPAIECNIEELTVKVSPASSTSRLWR